jgi:hypothetical protein
MKNISIPIAAILLATLLAACDSGEPTTPSGQPARAGMPAETLTLAASPPPGAGTTNQPGHEYLVYGIKTVDYTMSDYDANLKKIPLNQYITENTDIYSYSVDEQAIKLIFSDRSLPVFILHTSGGGETAIHDIVAAAPGAGKLYARMLPRDQYTTHEDAGALYELSSDGNNQYTKLFNFDSPDAFTLSPEGLRIASLSGSALLVRSLRSGEIINQVNLDAFKDDWISKFSWAPDGKTLLMEVAAGETSVTPAQPYGQTTGSYLVNISDGTMKKLSLPIFQNALELTSGFLTDPASYSFFPRSNLVIGMARKYDAYNDAVELFSVDLEGSNLVEIPIGNKESVWEFSISPNERFIAYQCRQNICVKQLPGAGSVLVSQTGAPTAGANQEQTVIGWLER